MLLDTPIQIQLWKMGTGTAYLWLMNGRKGKPVSNRGVFHENNLILTILKHLTH